MGKKSKKGQGRRNNTRPKKGNGQRGPKNVSSHSSETSTSEPVAKAVEVEEKEAVTATTESVSPVAESTAAAAEVVEEEKPEEKEAEAKAKDEAKDEDEAEDKAEDKDEVRSELPFGLESSMHLLSERQEKLVRELCGPPYNQGELFSHWPGASATASKSSEAVDEIKKQFVSQLEELDQSMSNGGGLTAYLDRAMQLLNDSASGKNPLDGWSPSIPTGETLALGTPQYSSYEQAGAPLLGACGFVLVAGGLGERLGYSNIKIGLPTEMATQTSYIQFYIETILAYQAKFAKHGAKLPLCIMTSNDTNDRTVQLLHKNNYFGMDKDQITIVQQGQGVPALSDNTAKMVLEANNKYKLQAKPHGHGDIHALLHTHSVAQTWLHQHGIQYIVFFQDTNGLAFHTLPVALGVSHQLNLIMNSIAVPRKAKQAIGGICKLTHRQTSQQRTINVEYNQLDPLLCASEEFPNGDVNDENTGYSPFPGNINQLLFHLPRYCKVLERTKGAMPEFVNPKYADESKTIFKKPTRLECMMQDFPTVLNKEEATQVGFTSVAADMCFSPVKNATSDGVALQSKGTHPGVAASGEADQYAAIRQILQSIGCHVQDGPKSTYLGIEVALSPQIVFSPNFVSYPGEYKIKFTNPSAIKISKRSSLVIRGNGNVIIESLDLDGALVIDCQQQNECIVRDLVVQNEGWEILPTSQSGTNDEIIRMRGYTINKIDTKTILFKADGTVEGYAPPVSKEEVKESSSSPSTSQKEETTAPAAPVAKEEVQKTPQQKLPEQKIQPSSLTEPNVAESNEVAGKDCCIIL